MDKADRVMAGFWEIFNKRNWLNGIRMKQKLRDYKPSEIHCVEYIGAHGDCNVTALADAFYMTRSAISKLTRKLAEKGLVESYQRPDNRKEVYFRLTEQGRAVNQIHETLHREHRERDNPVFEAVSDEQYDAMLRFVELYSRHLDAEIAKQGLDLKSADYDRL